MVLQNFKSCYFQNETWNNTDCKILYYQDYSDLIDISDKNRKRTFQYISNLYWDSLLRQKTGRVTIFEILMVFDITLSICVLEKSL